MPLSAGTKLSWNKGSPRDGSDRSKTRRAWGLWLFMFLSTGALGLAQWPRDSGLKTRGAIEGSETVRGYELSPNGRVVLDPTGQICLRLPPLKPKAVPELMG